MAASRALVDTNPPVSTQIKGISARRDGPLPCPYPVKCGSLLCPQHPTAPASAYVPESGRRTTAMAIANFIAQLARMDPTGAIIAVTFIPLTVPALVGGILVLS